MKPQNTIIPVVVSTIMIAALPAAALEIGVTENGTVQFFEDSVLGESTDGSKVAQGRPIRQVLPSENKQLRIYSTGEGASVGIESKNGLPTDMSSERLKVQVPAQLKTARADSADRVDQKPQVKELNAELKADRTEIRAEYKAYIEQVRQQRRERVEENIEILNDEKARNREQLEIRSRNITARMQKGAEFVYDPVTNMLTITTPSGNVHELNHLPDQAIAGMIGAGRIAAAEQIEGDLEIIEEEDTVLYQARVVKNKRLLGIFKRSVPSEVILDDSTGVVTEEEVEGTTLIDQILDTLSF